MPASFGCLGIRTRLASKSRSHQEGERGPMPTASSDLPLSNAVIFDWLDKLFAA